MSMHLKPEVTQRFSLCNCVLTVAS